jgi:hypothetical protein
MGCRSWPISRSNGCICSLRIECRSELAAIPMSDDETIVLRKTHRTDGRRSSCNLFRIPTDEKCLCTDRQFQAIRFALAPLAPLQAPDNLVVTARFNRPNSFLACHLTACRPDKFHGSLKLPLHMPPCSLLAST